LYFAVAALIGLPTVHGQLVVSNLGDPNGGGSGSVGSDKWAAQGFVTSGTSVVLHDVDLKLAVDPGASGTYTVALWNASGPGGTPGSQLNVVSSANPLSALTQTLTDYYFFATSGITLAANTTYFIVLTSSTSAYFGTPALQWAITSNKNGSGTGPGQIAGWAISPDSGANWGSDPATGYTEHTVSPDYPYQIGINAVPEPAAYAAVVGFGLVGFSVVRRWRQNRRRVAEVGGSSSR
jgi:hypothetical protein